MAAGPPIKTFIKDPDSVLDYTLDWNGGSPGPWLSTGDTISTSAWTLSSTGINGSTDSSTTTTTTINVRGGTAGEDYDLTNRITTANGLTTDRTIRIKVLEK
jgi:hypothetical protein